MAKVMPEMTFAIPVAPKLTAVVAIAAPMAAAETGPEQQEVVSPVISAGARNRM